MPDYRRFGLCLIGDESKDLTMSNKAKPRRPSKIMSKTDTTEKGIETLIMRHMTGTRGSTNGASSSRQNNGQGVVKGLWVSIPPAGEQASIVAPLAEATNPLNNAIAQNE